MALTTYAELQASIADWLNRDDLTAVIPSLIHLAESELTGKLDHWKADKKVTLTLDARYVDLPADFEVPRRFELTTDGVTGTIDYAAPDHVADLRAGNADAPGIPCVYTLTAGQIELWPTPATTQSAELVYQASVTPLSDTAPVNWLLTTKPAIYLYGALLQSAPYLKDDARIAVWGALHQEALLSLSTANEAAKHGGPLRIRQR